MHFNPENIPDIVFNSINLHKRKPDNPGGRTWLSGEEKIGCLNHFLDIADRIPSRYFVTKNGLRLGMPPHKVIDYYGKPACVETISEGKLLSWYFAADPSLPAMPGVETKEGQPYAENSYGYRLKILFDNEKATAILMMSNIP